jgi:hypothetical protein
MADKLISPGFLGPERSVLGIDKISDNHGNSISGVTLLCIGKNPVDLSAFQAFSLHESIKMAFYGPASDIVPKIDFHPTVSLPDGQVSPLSSACGGLNKVKGHAK